MQLICNLFLIVESELATKILIYVFDDLIEPIHRVEILYTYGYQCLLIVLTGLCLLISKEK
jgi:hypothetical protein